MLRKSYTQLHRYRLSAAARCEHPRALVRPRSVFPMADAARDDEERLEELDEDLEDDLDAMTITGVDRSGETESAVVSPRSLDRYMALREKLERRDRGSNSS